MANRENIYERLLEAATQAVPEHPNLSMLRWDCFGFWQGHLERCVECQKTIV